MTRILSFALAWFCCLPAFAADAPVERPAPAPVESWLDVEPTPYGPMLIQQGPPPPYRDYQMSRVLTPEERQRWLQMAMPVVGSMMQVDAREAMNHFAVKYTGHAKRRNRHHQPSADAVPLPPRATGAREHDCPLPQNP